MWSVPLGRKLLYGEAVARLVGAWVVIKLVPYKVWRSMLGQPKSISTSDVLTETSAQIAFDIATLHGVLLRVFGTRFTCLMLALSARGMLKLRGVPSELILGVNRNSTNQTALKLGAHAWVTSGNVKIIGHETSDKFITVAAYGCY